MIVPSKDMIDSSELAELPRCGLCDELRAELEQCHAKSTCCCGDYVKDHGMGSGHSPVSMYDHALDNANNEIKRLREALHKIADMDYRGNRSTESSIAFKALEIT